MKFLPKLAAAAALLAVFPAAAQPAPGPKLVVVVSVDQFSADLLAEYRGRFTGGLARLLSGAVFPSGYQSHAATETCPGHSTILSGARPARSGIVANDWIDPASARADKTIYCAEDPRVPGSHSDDYQVSDFHLNVPTLGEWMKAADPRTRVVSVAGKDRAAVMMGGHRIDEIWYWWESDKAFGSYVGRPVPPLVDRVNALVAERFAQPQPAMPLPDACARYDRAIALGGGKSVGTGRFARAAGSMAEFKASPELDEAVLALAAGFATEMKLGQGDATDLLIVGASATDYVGHRYGTEGTEMCLQLLTLDQLLGRFFAVLDATGVDYAVALTADHGGHDLPERNRERGAPTAERLASVQDGDRRVAVLRADRIGAAIGAKLGVAGRVLWGGAAGDLWLDRGLTPAQRSAVEAEVVATYSADRQVAAVFTRAQILATPQPKSPPETWSLIERVRASYHPDRSGDLFVALKPRVVPIVDPTRGSVATHGSIWDYDRRVPILFWRKGMTGFEQPLSIETVDIAPTLAALVGVKVPVEIDGRCLDLDAGAADSCK